MSYFLLNCRYNFYYFLILSIPLEFSLVESFNAFTSTITDGKFLYLFMIEIINEIFFISIFIVIYQFYGTVLSKLFLKVCQCLYNY